MGRLRRSLNVGRITEYLSFVTGAILIKGMEELNLAFGYLDINCKRSVMFDFDEAEIVMWLQSFGW